MTGFDSYDAWKTTPPPDDGEPDDDERCRDCGVALTEVDGEEVCPRCLGLPVPASKPTVSTTPTEAEEDVPF